MTPSDRKIALVAGRVTLDTIPRVTKALTMTEEVPALRERAKRAAATVDLAHAPEVLWPFFTNSDMLNQRSRYGPLTTRYAARPEGTPMVIGAGSLGPLTFEFVERPHSFVAPRWLDVDRPFVRGPIRYMGYRLDLERREGGGTRLKVEIRWVDRYAWFPGAFFMEDRLRRYVAEFKRIDAELGEGAGADEAPWTPFLANRRAHAAAIDKLAEAWAPLTTNPAVARAMAEIVIAAPDAYVGRIRTLAVAEAYGLSPIEVLSFALRAVRAGHLDMRWDILCPSCRGSAKGAAHLSEVAPTVHCPSCDIEYGAAFDENVEVTFFPVPRLRTFADAAFCAGPPSKIPHVGAQFLLEAGELRACPLDLPAGEYGLRDELSGLGSIRRFQIVPGGMDELSMRLGERLPGDGVLALAPGARLSAKNPASSFAILRLERLSHREKATTAAAVTSLQIFRDLFSSEVLRPGVKLGVSNVTILFSDLKDSTALYEQRGDAPAFALVQDHFDVMTEVIARREGGIVKTIGDAVMAVFTRPAEAVTAALEILEAFYKWNQSHGPEQAIVIKLGLHRGPCIALNLNDKLDYFGGAVNRAARVQGQSEGDDVVLSQELYEDPEVSAALSAAGPLSVTRFEAALKGLAGQATLIRIRVKRGD